MIRAALCVALLALGAAGTAQIAPAPVPAIRWTGTAMQGGLIRGTVPPGTRSLTLDGKPVRIAPDGRFVIGFDRDAPPSATLVASLNASVNALPSPLQSVAQTIAIAPRAWPISRLPTLPRYPVPEATFAAIRPGELARIAAARRIDGAAQGWQQAFVWPVTGRISTRFGAQRIYANGEAGAFHSGVDVARPTGTTVVAPADGVVILAADRPFTLEGNLLMIDHGMGLNSAFLHLSRIDVVQGQRVTQGQAIGAVGMTGRATGPHLHWSLRWNDARLDPMLAAGEMR